MLGDNVAAGVLLDRFLHHAEIVQLQGRSYRDLTPENEST
ncbi:MAG: ATP-binding protein [Candidatus Dormibacteraceae bacterium]